MHANYLFSGGGGGSGPPPTRASFNKSPNGHLKLGQLPIPPSKPSLPLSRRIPSTTNRSFNNTSSSSYLSFPSPARGGSNYLTFNRFSRVHKRDRNGVGTIFVKLAPLDLRNIPVIPMTSSSSSPGGRSSSILEQMNQTEKRYFPDTSPETNAAKRTKLFGSPPRGNNATSSSNLTPLLPSGIRKSGGGMMDESSSLSSSSPAPWNLMMMKKELSCPSPPPPPMMSSRSILEQMNQTEKRYFPDATPSSSAPKRTKIFGSSLSPPPRPGKTSTPLPVVASGSRKREDATNGSGGISMVEFDEDAERASEDPKSKMGKFCHCNECYAEAAGTFVAVSPPRNGGGSLLGSMNSKKMVSFGDSSMLEGGGGGEQRMRSILNLNNNSYYNNNASFSTVSTCDRGTETETEMEFCRPEIIIRRAAPTVITKEKYEYDNIKRIERFKRILGLPTKPRIVIDPEDVMDGTLKIKETPKSPVQQNNTFNFSQPIITPIAPTITTTTITTPITTPSNAPNQSTPPTTTSPPAAPFTFGIGTAAGVTGVMDGTLKIKETPKSPVQQNNTFNFSQPIITPIAPTITTPSNVASQFNLSNNAPNQSTPPTTTSPPAAPFTFGIGTSAGVTDGATIKLEETAKAPAQQSSTFTFGQSTTPIPTPVTSAPIITTSSGFNLFASPSANTIAPSAGGGSIFGASQSTVPIAATTTATPSGFNFTQAQAANTVPMGTAASGGGNIFGAQSGGFNFASQTANTFPMGSPSPGGNAFGAQAGGFNFASQTGNNTMGTPPSSGGGNIFGVSQSATPIATTIASSGFNFGSQAANTNPMGTPSAGGGNMFGAQSGGFNFGSQAANAAPMGSPGGNAFGAQAGGFNFASQAANTFPMGSPSPGGNMFSVGAQAATPQRRTRPLRRYR